MNLDYFIPILQLKYGMNGHDHDHDELSLYINETPSVHILFWGHIPKI